MRTWPRSLAGQTGLVLVAVLVVVQAAGLTIHGMDRVELQRLADARDLATRIVAIYRTLVAQPEGGWAGMVREIEPIPGVRYTLEPAMPAEFGGAASPEVQRLVRPHLTFGIVPPGLRPRATAVRGDYAPGRTLAVGLEAPDGRWLVTRAKAPAPRPWSSARFLLAFAIMTGTAALLAVWAVRRLTAPVRVLARAAERLGRDVNAPPLPEEGPAEVRRQPRRSTAWRRASAASWPTAPSC